MNLTNTMICWIPGTDDVRLHPWPDRDRSLSQLEKDHKKHYWTYGACNSEVHGNDFQSRKTLVFIYAVVMIIRDQCDPMAVHSALMGLDEYKDGCPDDMPIKKVVF